MKLCFHLCGRGSEHENASTLEALRAEFAELRQHNAELHRALLAVYDRAAHEALVRGEIGLKQIEARSQQPRPIADIAPHPEQPAAEAPVA